MDTELFSLKCNFYKKNFVNQRNLIPIYNDTRQVAAGNVNEMLNSMWKIVIESGCLEREIIVEGETVVWSADVPDVEHNQIDKFVQIIDVKGKRNYAPSNISTDLLTHLRNKEVHVIIFVYSRNVATNGTFTLVKKNLLDPVIKDRSSAVANQLVDEIIVKLKENHSHHLIAPQAIAWRIWATFIASKPSHTHEQLLLDNPPDHIVVFFRCIPTNEAEVLSNAQRGLRVARNVNGIQRTSLREIREKVQRIQSTINSCNQEIGSLLIHLDYLERQTEREDSLLRDMDGAVRPEESTYSIETANLVGDCDDVDHMD